MGPEQITTIPEEVDTREVAEQETTDGVERVVDANKEVDPNMKKEEADAQATEIVKQDETSKELKDLQEIMKAFEEDKTGSLSGLREDYKNLTTNIINKYEDSVRNVIDQKPVSTANNSEQLKSLNTSDSGAEVSWEGNEVQISSSVEGLDISSMSAAEAEKAVEEIMSNQPQEVQKQISEIKNVLSNGTKEQKNILNEVIKDMTDQIDKLYKEIKENSKEIPGGNGEAIDGGASDGANGTWGTSETTIDTRDAGGSQAGPDEGWMSSAEDWASYETVK